MSLHAVTMKPPAGADVPSLLHLPDSSTVKPDAAGQFNITSNFITMLLAAGWTVVTPG